MLRHAVIPDHRGALHIVAVNLPPESAADHTRNALQILAGLRVTNPALWLVAPELARAERRARSGLAILAIPGGRPLAGRHLRRAVESLCESDIQWDVVTDVHDACALLLRATFALESEMTQ